MTADPNPSGRPRRVLYPGSFDPLHLGHLDVIEQAHELFGDVVVAVMYNFAKPSGMFDVDERVALIEQAVDGLERVTVEARVEDATKLILS